MRMLLSGDAEILSALREQFEVTKVARREMTGSGFYTQFAVSDSTRRVPGNRSFKFGDVIAKIPGLNFGAGVLLYVKDGVLDMLEGYSFEEKWPEQISNFELSYTTGAQGDMDAWQKSLA